MGTSVTGHTQPPVIDLRKVTKTYGVGETLVKAVRGIDLTVHTGDYVAVMGASGSGKSTLMNVLGCLDTPTTGHYFLDGLDLALNGFFFAVFAMWGSCCQPEYSARHRACRNRRR